MKTIQRDWDWWAYHFRVVHRSQIPGIDQWDDDLVQMILEVLDLEPGDRVLDLACGSGNHARRLARQGLEILRIDIAPSLVAYCRERAAAQGLVSVRFEQGDMRDLAYEDEFDAALMLSGSFGFFDDATNLNVLSRLARSLRSGGRVLIDVSDPGEMIVRPPRRTWSRYGEGFALRTTWWEPESCTYVSEFLFIDAGGVLNTAGEPERIRIYTLPEWRAMFSRVGVRLTHALGDTALPLVTYDREHYANLVLVGQKA